MKKNFISNNVNNDIDIEIYKYKYINKSLKTEIRLIKNREEELDEISEYMVNILRKIVTADRVSKTGLTQLSQHLLNFISYKLEDIQDLTKRQSRFKKDKIEQIFEIVNEKLNKMEKGA